MAAKIQIIAGDVLKVQLTSETHVASAARRGGVVSRIVNRMRVVLRNDADGKERDFVFANSTVGVREGHRVALVLAHLRGGPPVQLALVNETTGQREEYEAGFALAARPQRLFGPAWRAAGLAAILFALGFLASLIAWPDRQLWWRVLFPLFLALLSFPVLYLGVRVVERFGGAGRTALEIERLRTEIAEQLGRSRAPPPPGELAPR